MWLPLVALVLPRRLAPVLPTTYSPRCLLLKKAQHEAEHSGFPYRTFVHCKGFAPAAPRGARASISVPFSGLPLSRPLLIKGLVVRYTANNLISRHLILKRRIFRRTIVPDWLPYPVLSSVSRRYPRLEGRLMTCY